VALHSYGVFSCISFTLVISTIYGFRHIDITSGCQPPFHFQLSARAASAPLPVISLCSVKLSSYAFGYTVGTL